MADPTASASANPTAAMYGGDWRQRWQGQNGQGSQQSGGTGDSDAYQQWRSGSGGSWGGGGGWTGGQSGGGTATSAPAGTSAPATQGAAPGQDASAPAASTPAPIAPPSQPYGQWSPMAAMYGGGGGLGEQSTGPTGMVMGDYGAAGAWDGGYNPTAAQSAPMGPPPWWGANRQGAGPSAPAASTAPAAPAYPASTPTNPGPSSPQDIAYAQQSAGIASTQQSAQAAADAARAAFENNPGGGTSSPLYTAWQQAAQAAQQAQSNSITNASANPAASHATAATPDPYGALSNGMTLGPLGTNNPIAIDAYNAQDRADAQAAYQANPNDPAVAARYQRSFNSAYNPTSAAASPADQQLNAARLAALNAGPAGAGVTPSALAAAIAQHKRA